jgi:branched-chain amino acid transport system substrate-binding protein
VLAAAAVAISVELTRGSNVASTATANSLVAIDPATGRVEAVIATGRGPNAVAVGAGAVWVLNADDGTISKIDPKRKHLVATFGTGEAPADLAVGKDAVWVASGGTPIGAGPVTLTRIDPGTGAVVASLRPSPGPGPITTIGTGAERELAVGTGGIWFSDPLSETLWRIDNRTNQVGLRLKGIGPRSLVSTPRAVWLANEDGSVQALRPDGRKAQRIPLTATTLDDVTYGAGSIWALDRPDGTLWRVDPGPRPVSRTIQVGVGASRVAFGEGSVWVANGFDGTILRVDPSKNRVTQTLNVGGVPRAIAAGDGRVWAAIDGAGALRAASCGPVVSGGAGKPDFVVVSDFPLQGSERSTTAPAAAAVGLVLRQHRFRAGRYTVGYQSCDDSTAQSGGSDPYKCAANAHSYAGDPSVIGEIGPFNSPCGAVEIPIASRASLPVVSPSNSWPGLTRAGPGNAPGEPGMYYPTGVHSYFRVSSTDADQAAADALLAKQLGDRRVFALHLFVPGSTSDYGLAVATHFAQEARRLGLTVVGSSRWLDDPKMNRALVARVVLTRPDAVFLGGGLCGSCGDLIRRLRTRLGPRVAIIGNDAFDPASTRDAAGDAAIGMYVSFDEAPASALPTAGRRFTQDFARLNPEFASGDYPPWVPYAAESTGVLLAAIAHSDGTRASVVKELRELPIENGLLGSFHFDRYGDATVNYTTIARIVKNPPRDSAIAGAVVDRVLTVPPSPGR